MNDQQLTERLTRAADNLPPAAGTPVVEVQRRASVRRRHRHLRRGVVAMAIVVGVVVSVPSITAPGGLPEIAPWTQQPESAPPPEAPSGEIEGPADVTEPSGSVGEQRAPQADQLDEGVELEVYSIVAPDGWGHVDTGVRTIASESWTWVETRWTPSGGAGGGESDARLDLRQTDVATLGDAPIPMNADADSVELKPGVTAYLATERLPSGVEFHLLEWQQGGTYLELKGQGLTAQELTSAAATAEPTPSESPE